MPLAQAHERAGLLSAFYILGYTAFSLPAVLTGFSVASIGIGLRWAADIYSTMVILLALASLAAARMFRDAADDRTK
jgi:hypothetical protein